MLYHSITQNKYFYNGLEISKDDYIEKVNIVKEKVKMADNIIKGLSVIDDVPDEWKAEVNAIIKSRTDTDTTEETDDTATVEDYQNALTELGVDFDA